MQKLPHQNCQNFGETFIGIRNRAGWNFGHLAESRIHYIYMAAMRC